MKRILKIEIEDIENGHLVSAVAHWQESHVECSKPIFNKVYIKTRTDIEFSISDKIYDEILGEGF